MNRDPLPTNRDELAQQDWLRGALSDEDVVCRVLAGESELFEFLMRRHNQRLFRTVRSMLGNDADAEEVLQEAYVSAFQNLAQFEGRANVGSWLMRILVNAANKRLQSRYRMKQQAEDYAKEQVNLGTESFGPEGHMARGELRVLLENSVDALAPDYRTVFVLRRVENLSILETSDALGVTTEIVKIRLHRASARLRELLQHHVDLSGKLGDLYSFDGERCDRIVQGVMGRIASQ